MDLAIDNLTQFLGSRLVLHSRNFFRIFSGYLPLDYSPLHPEQYPHHTTLKISGNIACPRCDTYSSDSSEKRLPSFIMNVASFNQCLEFRRN